MLHRVSKDCQDQLMGIGRPGQMGCCCGGMVGGGGGGGGKIA